MGDVYIEKAVNLTKDGFDGMKELCKEDEDKTESCKGGLWLTIMGRVTLDNHNGETFNHGSDIKLMSKEELDSGINVLDFQERWTNGLLGRHKTQSERGTSK